MNNSIIRFMSVVYIVINHVECIRIKDSIYQELDGSHSCFKIMNATHEFGCTGQFSGNTGVLFAVNSTDKLNSLMKLHGGFELVIILQRQLFTVETLQALEVMSADPVKVTVRGVVLVELDPDVDPRTFSYSEEDTCPNHVSSFYKPDQHAEQYNYCLKSPWNPSGSGMLKQHWTFPILLLKNQTQISDIYRCHAEHNLVLGMWPHCSVELYAFMVAAGSTRRCWHRTQSQYINSESVAYCSPLGSFNVHNALYPSPPQKNDTSATTAAPLLMIAARLDGATVFDAVAPAADSAAVAVVTLLAVARALADLKPQLPDKLSSNVMFMLFSGESFDYIGSERFAYDVSRGEFPAGIWESPTAQHQSPAARRLQLSDIHQYIELNQLAAARQLFIHSDPVTRDNSTDARVDSIAKALLKEAGKRGLSLSEAERTLPLPPSSLHALLKAHSDLPGLVITDHAAEYTNRHYHSQYDSAGNVGWPAGPASNSTSPPLTPPLLDHVTAVTRVLTGAVFSLLTNQPSPQQIAVNQTWIAELLECYLVRSNCSAFRRVMSRPMDKLQGWWMQDSEPIPTYVSVFGSVTWHTHLYQLTRNLLATATGQQLPNVVEEDCRDKNSTGYSYQWLLDGVFVGSEPRGYCVRSLIGISPAVSPAFEIPDYDWSSGRYSSWSESRWFEFRARMFLQPSHIHDSLHLLAGVLTTFILATITMVISRYADMVFTERTQTGFPRLQRPAEDRSYGSVVTTAGQSPIA